MRLFSILAAISLTLSAYVVVGQKYEWKQASSAGYTYKYVTNDPMATRFYTLKNGLTLILSPNKKEPRIAARIAVRTGSNTDPKDHTGLAHYLEHLLFKGTDQFGSLDWAKEKPFLDQIDNLYEQYNLTTDTLQRRNIYHGIDSVSGLAAKYAIANEYDKLMASIGAQGSNAGTSVESTVYQEDIPSNALNKFLTIQAERFRNPIFRIFHTELEAVYEEKNRTLDNDGRKVLYAMLENLFPTHNYGQQTTIGTIEHLKNPSLKAIRDYYRKYYVPNNIALIFSGDFNFDEVIKSVDSAFSYMQPKPVEEYKGPREKPISGPIIKEVYGPSAESVRIAFRSEACDTRESMLADLLSSILYNGKAGLLDLNLNKQQKVLSSNAALYQFKDYGVFFVDGTSRQGQSLEEVKSLLMNQVEMLKKGSFDETLVKAIVANFKLDRLKSLEDNGGRVEEIADQFIKNRGDRWQQEVALVDEMNKVTKKELVEFANKFFGDNNYVVVFKRKGEDKSIVKVDKPAITPVETNAGKTSEFVKNIAASPLPPLKPMWLDYTRDLQKAKEGNADILYVQNKENELFSLTYRFNMGNWNNKVLALAAQYLQFLATDKMSPDEISKRFYNLACSFSIIPGNEETVISISGLQENFDKAVALFEEVLHNCKPDSVALEGLVSRLEKARANNKLNKQIIALALRNYATYGAANPFNYVLTNKEMRSIKATDLTDLLHNLENYEHKITYYGPQPLTTLTAKMQALHKIPASWTANAAAVKFERTKQTNNQVLFTDYDAVQAEVYWIKNLQAYDPKQEALVNMFNGYFGGGMGSVVFQTIRESKALAYSTSAYVMTPIKKNDNFAMIAYVGTQADKFNEAVAGMNELLTDLPKTDQNFENARKTLLKDIETERITKDAIIVNYLNAQKKGVDHDLRKDNYLQYSSLSLDDLYKYHREQFSKQPYTYCVVASNKRVSLDALKKFGEVKVLSLEELFGY